MPGPPYDNLETIVTAARIRLNDSIASANGEVLTDNASFTIQTINNGWRRLQEFLAESNAARLINETIITGLPVVATSDPGIFTQLNWTGFLDGANPSNPLFVLPQDMIFPLRLWERQSGLNPPQQFTDMELVIDGWPGNPKQSRNYNWEWRSETLILSGSTVSMDLKIRYAAYLPDFVPAATQAFNNQPVPILRVLDSFAWYIATEMAAARGDMDATALITQAEAAAKKLIEQDTRRAAMRSQFTVPDIPPAQGNTPYDSVSTMINAARVRLNALAKGAGDSVSTSQAFLQQATNTAWRRLQEFLIGQKFKRLMFTAQVLNLPAVSSTDPGIMCSLTWNGYSNSGGAPNPGLKLPANLVRPLKLWERASGQSNPPPFTPMEYVENGLGQQAKQGRNLNWEWISDSLNIPGATQAMDLQIRYEGYLPDFVTSGTTPWYLQPIPISRALDSLAWFMVAEIATARPDLNLDADAIKGIQSTAEAAAMLLVSQDKNAADQRGEWTVPDLAGPYGTTPAPYDSVVSVLNAARARLNRVAGVSGDIISINQAFTQQYFNNAWRKFQEYLANLGADDLMTEILLTALPTVTSLDPASQTVLSWSGFFDGTNQQSAPQLPNDLIRPVKIWERYTGTNALFQDPGMEQMVDGLVTLQKFTYNGQWCWQAGAILMPGSTQSMDLRIRYARYLPDFVQNGYGQNISPWYAQPVPIARCQDSLSLYVCAEVAMARPDLNLDPSELRMEAEAMADKVFNRDVRSKQRVNVRRISRSGRLEGAGGGDYGLLY